MNFRIITVGTILATAAASQADISFYDFFRTGDFTQTSNSQPVSANPNGYFWTARIFGDVGDFTNGTYTDANGNDHTMSLDPGQKILSYGQGGYNNDASMVPDFMNPGGGQQGFTYAFSGGTLGSQSAVLMEPESPSYPDAIPFLTGTGYSTLQSLLPGQSVALNWNSFGSNATFQITFFTIYDFTANAYVVNNSGDAGTYTGDTLNGTDVIAGHQYQYSLFFSSRNSQVGAGFGTGIASEGFDYVTSGQFEVVPEPASVLAVGLGAGVVLLRRRKR